MSEATKEWDGEIVRKWLESRFTASMNDQDAADQRGWDSRDDYDKAAAEEWCCRVTKSNETTNSQDGFAAYLKTLLAKDGYQRAGVYDDRHFEREVRAYLRKLTKMAKANMGFENLLRYQ